MKRNYDVIIFDIDDTLCKNNDTKTNVFLNVYKSNQKLKKIPKNRFVDECKKSWRKYLDNLKEIGFNTYSRLGMWMNLDKKFDLSLNIKDIKKLVELYWKWSIRLTRPYPGLKKVLKFIKSKNLVLCTITGGDFYSKARKLMKLNIDSYFDYLFPTEIVQSNKSNGNIYLYVVKYLKTKPERILMIGDKPDQDIAPANNVGLKTVQAMMRGDQTLYKKGINKPDFGIYALEEVIDIISSHT